MQPAIYEFTEAAYRATKTLIQQGEAFVNIVEHTRLKFPYMIFKITMDGRNFTYHVRSGDEFKYTDEDQPTEVDENYRVKCTYVLAEGPGFWSACTYRYNADYGLEARASTPRRGYEDKICPGRDFYKISSDDAAAMGCEVSLLLAYLNMPLMSDCELIDNTQWNLKREKRGQLPVPNRTIVRPHASKLLYLEYVRDCENNDDIVPEKWWGGFWNFYWCGRRGEQWLEMRWIEGRCPEHKQAQYVVRSRKIAKDPDSRLKQLAQRRHAVARAEQ